MSMRFDATMKDLLAYRDHWLALLGLDIQGAITEITAELSTVTAAADKVFRIDEAAAWLLHMELQASRDSLLPQRLLKYNVLLYDRYGLAVHSIVILLRREADDPGLGGVVHYGQRADLGGLDFHYRVVRLWEWPVEAILTGGLGTLPLAPLSAEVTEATLAQVIRRMDERLGREADAAEAARLWTASFVLSGLRFHRKLTNPIFKGVRAMKESDTYQAIVEEGEIKGRAEGRADEARRLLLRQGRIRFGFPDQATEADLAAIADLERLERMSERLLQVHNWQELLDSP